jgi:hypothetical protein
VTPSNINIIEFCNKIADDQLSLEEIKRNIISGVFTLDEIYHNINDSKLSMENLDIIMSYLNFNILFEFYNFNDFPQLLPKRTDIYVLGNYESGKSTFLSNLFSYINNQGLCIEHTHNLIGNLYKDKLQFCFNHGFFPNEGIHFGVNYICCDLLNIQDHNQVHPLNIIEFNYQKIDLATHINNCFDPNSNAKQFLKNDNSKILLFFIEYSQNQEKIINDSQNLNRLLQRLEQFGILARTTNINIVITKCDLFPAHIDPMEFAVTYINQNYLSFITDCKSISNYYNGDLKIKVFPFSVGKLSFKSSFINEKNYSWTKKILDEIFSTSFYKKRTTSFFSRFFK